MDSKGGAIITMGNLLTTEGNPQQSHDPLPDLTEVAREVTLNPLRAKVVLECLPSVDKEDNSNDNDDGKSVPVSMASCMVPHSLHLKKEEARGSDQNWGEREREIERERRGGGGGGGGGGGCGARGGDSVSVSERDLFHIITRCSPL